MTDEVYTVGDFNFEFTITVVGEQAARLIASFERGAAPQRAAWYGLRAYLLSFSGEDTDA